MKDPDAARVGMFGYAENAHIYNITLRDYDIASAGRNALQRSVAPILPVVTMVRAVTTIACTLLKKF